MARGLLIILGLEGVTAIVIDAGGLTEDALGPVAAFAGLLLVTLSLTLLDTFTSISDSLPKRNGERVEPRPRLAVPWIRDRVDQAKQWLEKDSMGDESETPSRQEALRKKRRQAVEEKIRKARKELDAVRLRVKDLDSPDGEPTTVEAKAEDALGRAEEGAATLLAIGLWRIAALSKGDSGPVRDRG